MRLIRLFIIFALSLVTVYRLFFGLGDKPIERWDEETNINVVSDSITQNNFPVLYLGSKPFFEKPPLWYFLNSVIAKTSGISNTSMRLTSAVSGLLIILVSAYLAWYWWGNIAMIITWTVLLTSEQLFTTNVGGYFATHTLRSADLDALQILFLLIAFLAAVQMKGRLVPLILGISSGLAILTKGPMGLLPIVFLSILLLTKRKIDWRSLLISWLSLALVVLPWYTFMTIKFGNDFLLENMGYHISERVLTPLEGHQASIWFYGEILGSGNIFPAGILLLISLVWIVVRKKYKNRRLFFLTLMVISCFVIPSIVQTKLAWYILPIYPFAAMLIGAFFEDVTAR